GRPDIRGDCQGAEKGSVTNADWPALQAFSHVPWRFHSRRFSSSQGYLTRGQAGIWSISSVCRRKRKVLSLGRLSGGRNRRGRTPSSEIPRQLGARETDPAS